MQSTTKKVDKKRTHTRELKRVVARHVLCATAPGVGCALGVANVVVLSVFTMRLCASNGAESKTRRTTQQLVCAATTTLCCRPPLVSSMACRECLHPSERSERLSFTPGDVQRRCSLCAARWNSVQCPATVQRCCFLPFSNHLIFLFFVLSNNHFPTIITFK